MPKPSKSSAKAAPQDKAIHYNENVEAYVKSGKVEPNARKAAAALDDEEEAIELQRAETVGKSHANRPRMDPPPKPKKISPAPKR
jgi:hypothetical protein